MVVEDDLYLGAHERRGEIEKEREERERGGHEQSRTFITLGTNFLTLETCSLTSHPGIYIEHSCSSDVTIDENRLYSDCNNLVDVTKISYGHKKSEISYPRPHTRTQCDCIATVFRRQRKFLTVFRQ